jgi:hypothetical protein
VIMTTDAPDVSALTPVDEPDTSRQPNIDEQQATLLDIAGMLSLTRTDSELVTIDAIAKMLGAHAAEIDANGRWRRALLAGDVQAVGAEIGMRTELRQELANLRQNQSDLRVRFSSLETNIARLEGELVRRRHEAEDAQLEQQIEALRHEESEAQRRAANDPSDNAQSNEEIAAKRKAAIALLEKNYQAALAVERPSFQRAERLAARSITQTVAGFLLWLGYGSVAATGAVLALMMNGGDSGQFVVIIEAWRGIVDSIGLSSVWQKLVAGVGLVAVLLALVGSSIVAAERWLLKKREDWNRDEQRNRDPQVNLSPQSITRKTYTQFIAILPFLFGAGIIATILSVTPVHKEGGRSETVLTSVLPTLGYAFVGIVIAFLATAVFVMYVVRIIEPRSKDSEERTNVLKAGWEFVVPPLVLVVAVAATPFILNSSASTPAVHIVAGEWVPWAAFMLMSSLALACGVVYHGVFKDAKMARERLATIESQLDSERRLLAGGVPKDEVITRDYGEELRRIDALRRDLRLGRLGVSISARNEDTPMLVRAWRWLRRPAGGNGADDRAATILGPSTGGYRPIDYAVAADVISDLAKYRSERAFTVAELGNVEDAIRRSEQFAAFEVMLPLKRKLAALKGDIDASEAEDIERKNRAAITGEILTLGVKGVIANGKAVKPFFNGVRADLAERVPYMAIGDTQGDDHE